MKVKELKKLLEALDDSMEVVLPSNASPVDVQFYGASIYKPLKKITLENNEVILE